MRKLEQRIWLLPLLCLVLLFAIVASVWIAMRATPPVETAPSLSETEITRLANAALAVEYVGVPTQVTIRQTTVGALNKFHCGKIGEMISAIVSPMQGNPDVCAADSTVWVVTLHGNFRRANFVTQEVQVILDRAGRMMSVDSGELVQATW